MEEREGACIFTPGAPSGLHICSYSVDSGFLTKLYFLRAPDHSNNTAFLSSFLRLQAGRFQMG